MKQMAFLREKFSFGDIENNVKECNKMSKYPGKMLKYKKSAQINHYDFI